MPGNVALGLGDVSKNLRGFLPIYSVGDPYKTKSLFSGNQNGLLQLSSCCGGSVQILPWDVSKIQVIAIEKHPSVPFAAPADIPARLPPANNLFVLAAACSHCAGVCCSRHQLLQEAVGAGDGNIETGEGASAASGTELKVDVC